MRGKATIITLLTLNLLALAVVEQTRPNDVT
jgi:hypothetical protein